MQGKEIEMIQQYQDGGRTREEELISDLANGQIQFDNSEVLNFIKNLTYGCLEKLYTKVNEGKVLYKLLLECLKERLGGTLSE